MRIEKRDDGTTVVWFRQSWVNDYFICPERARLTAVHGQPDGTNEAAALGTAMHAGIERGVGFSESTPAQVFNGARDSLLLMETHGEFAYDELTASKARAHITSWAQQLRGVQEFQELRAAEAPTEQSFDILVDTRGDTEMRWEGTCDAYLPGRYLVDWKTSSRQYQPWEKQRWAVQPTMYSEAARQLGWVDSDIVDFRFVVFDRGSKPPQVVRVERGPEHTAWLTVQLWRVYDQDLTEPWPLNDQHALCSPKWCPRWDMCKGLFIADDFKARKS